MKKQVLLFVLMLMPLMASAQIEEIDEIDGIYYYLNSTFETAVVTSGTSEYTGSIVIPKTVTYGGVTFSVTSIGHWAFSGCSGLTSVTIPNSVTSIGGAAFSGCSGLTSITIPNSVTSIEGGAFSGCSGLTSITILNSVTSIEGDTFSDCSIEKITFHCQGIGSWFSNMKSIKEVIIGDEVKNIGHNAFSGCSGLTSVTIPNSVTSIGVHAFSGCSGLTSITIPNSVTSIGGYVFRGCSSLTSIVVENGNTVYDSRNNCNAIVETSTNELIVGCKSTIIPNNVTSIGDAAFSGCSSLTSITIPNSVTSIGGSTFWGCSSLTSINIPNSVTSIGNGAFSGCSGLTSITIPNSVTSIGNGAFSGCSGITSLSIGDGVSSIGSNAFYGCSGLTSVSIPQSVSSIKSSVFQGCSGLSSVIVSSSIKSIESKAFANCTELKDMYCYAVNVPTLSSDTFQDTNYIKWGTLYVPEESVELYKKSTWSQYFGNIVGISGWSGLERCAKPIITLLANGKVKVESATEGAACITNITATNAEPITDGEIGLNTPLIVYTVTSYATKEGYDDSEVATATFRYEKAEGDMNGDGMLNITDVIHLVNMILSK